MMLGSTMTAAEEKQQRKAKAAAYAASLGDQIHANKQHKIAEKSNEKGLGGIYAPKGNYASEQKARDHDIKKERQMAYKSMLDAQRAESRLTNETDEVVPTALTDRPF